MRKLGFTNRDLARRLGVGESYLSNVFAGRKPGSPQLLAALEILVELLKAQERENLRTQLEKLKPDPDLEAELADLRAKNLRRLQQAGLSINEDQGVRKPQEQQAEENVNYLKRRKRKGKKE